jgi:prostaglandin-E synthase
LIALQKKDTSKPFWGRLLKSANKNPYVQIDWGRWIEEDEQEGDAKKGMGDFDLEKMKGFPGMSGNDQDNSDDENEGNIDDLEKNEEIQEKGKEKDKEEEKEKKEKMDEKKEKAP